MNRKFEQEKQNLMKLGIPEDMAFLLASNKLGINQEEISYLVKDIKDQQQEIKDLLQDFKPLNENLKEFKPLNENLISNNNNIDNVKN